MRVDLRLVAHPAGAQAERLHRPVQVVPPLLAAQRQAFAERRLIYLDDTDASSLQVADLVANGQRQLSRLHLARHVLAGERPHQHGHRTGEHAFHDPVRLLLGIPDPVHGHRARTAQIAIDDRRFDAARAVALHPAKAGKDVAFELFGEVLHHVVALRLAMHQHIQADLLLHRHRMADFGLHRLGVVTERQPALLVSLARQADRRRLRERTDSRGRECRQLQPRALQLDARGEHRRAPTVLGLDSGQACLYRRLVDARRLRAGRLDCAAAGERSLHFGVLRIVDGPGERGDFRALLHRKGEPALHFLVQPVLALEVDGAVQQRTGRRQPQALAQAFGRMPCHFERLVQITAPDVAPVDQPQRQHLVGRQAIENHRILLRGAHQVDVQAVHRQGCSQTEIVFQAAEVGGDQLLQRRPLQQVVGAFERILPVLRQVQRQNWLVDLHPLDSLRRQPVQHLAVNRQQPVQQLQLVEGLGLIRLALELAEPEIAQRADQHWLDGMPQRLGLFDLFEELRPGQLELLVDAELRDQIVVVGIEPLGHFLSLGTTAATPGHAARHGEQGVQRRLAFGRTESLRDDAEHQGMTQHLVVPGEVAHRQQLDASVELGLPMTSPQLATDLAQALLVQLAFPVRLEGRLQFAIRTDAWKAKVMRYSHYSLRNVVLHECEDCPRANPMKQTHVISFQSKKYSC